MFRKIVLLSLFLSVGITAVKAQRLGISNNVLFDIDGALSAGVEIPLSKMSSLEAYGSLRPWKRSSESVHKHWLVQAQYRLWPCQVMNGFFYGPYVHAGEFNLGNRNVSQMFLDGLKPYRYEGWLAGVGIGVGYEYALARHWNIGAEAGLGYTYIDYKKFDCERCGPQRDDDVYHYFGLSRLGLSLIYVF